MNTTGRELENLTQTEYNEKLQAEITSVAAQVEYILQRYESARNDDTLLEFVWLRIFKNVKIPFVDFEILKEAKLESVRRVRAKFNEKGMYMPTDYNVLVKRRRKQAGMREVMPRFDPTTLGDFALSSFEKVQKKK